MENKLYFVLLFVFINKLILAQSPDIVEIEYYFDTDPGFGNGIEVAFSADSLVDVDFTADLSLVDVGYHKFFVRIKDENGKWSLAYKQDVYKAGMPTSGQPLPDLVAIEYYFDVDPGFGNGEAIALTSDSLVNVDFTADLSLVDVGYHKLFVRTKDENGKWSLAYKQDVYKAGMPTSGQPLPDLVAIEYYFDVDPGFGNGESVSITSDSLIDKKFRADMTALSIGTHQFYVRVKDENNKWSLIYDQEIEKINANQWLGTVDTVWNNAANWSYNTVPIANDFVEILNVVNQPVISGISAECYSLELKSGVILILENNAVLLVLE